jgi:hypothetical protein
MMALFNTTVTVFQPLTIQRGVTGTARHSENIMCCGVMSAASHATCSHSFVYISTT